MIYFYLWCAVLALILLAPLVVGLVEKSKNKQAIAADEPAMMTEDGAMFDEQAEAEPAVADEMGGFGAEVPAGGDDFAAFDDFK